MSNYKIFTFLIMCVILLHLSDTHLPRLQCDSSKGLIYNGCTSACASTNKCSDQVVPIKKVEKCTTVCVEACVCKNREKCINDQGVCVKTRAPIVTLDNY